MKKGVVIASIAIGLAAIAIGGYFTFTKLHKSPRQIIAERLESATKAIDSSRDELIAGKYNAEQEITESWLKRDKEFESAINEVEHLQATMHESLQNQSIDYLKVAKLINFTIYRIELLDVRREKIYADINYSKSHQREPRTTGDIADNLKGIQALADRMDSSNKEVQIKLMTINLLSQKIKASRDALSFVYPDSVAASGEIDSGWGISNYIASKRYGIN